MYFVNLVTCIGEHSVDDLRLVRFKTTLGAIPSEK